VVRSSPDRQRNLIGERLYPQIAGEVGNEVAGKVTGMLLDLEVPDLLHLLESRDVLKQKVGEAMRVLEEHGMLPAPAAGRR
jgi:hypothetical protein